MNSVKFEDCPIPIHPTEGLKAAETLVRVLRGQMEDGSLRLCNTGFKFGDLEVSMTPEQYVKFALDALALVMATQGGWSSGSELACGSGRCECRGFRKATGRADHGMPN
jgi:hypothetical protein